MMKKYKIEWLRGRAGFTLLEVVATMLLSGIVALGLFEILGRITKSTEKVDYRLTQTAINSVGNLELTKLFLEVDGFNYQGEGPCNFAALDFWKFNPQEPNCILPNSNGAVNPSCTRERVLEIADGQTESDSFIMALNARNIPTAKPAMTMMSPPEFYDTTVVPVNSVDDFYVSGSLTYNPAKLIKFLKSVGLFYEGAILRMISPYPSRRLASDGMRYERTLPPRLPSATVTVLNNSIDERQVPFVTCEKLMDYKPEVDLNAAGFGFGKLDTFFRLIPARAGRTSPAMVKAMRVVRLRLKKETRNGVTLDMLMLSDWSPLACGTAKNCEAAPDSGSGVSGSYRNERVISENLKRLRIARSDIRVASVFFEAVDRYLPAKPKATPTPSP